GHEAHPRADSRLAVHGQADGGVAGGAGENGRGAEAGHELVGQALQLLAPLAARVPAGGADPDAFAREALERALEARPELVVEVPRLEAGGQELPQGFGVRQAIHLAQREVEGGAVAAVALVEARQGFLEHVLVALGRWGGGDPPRRLRRRLERRTRAIRSQEAQALAPEPRLL